MPDWRWNLEAWASQHIAVMIDTVKGFNTVNASPIVLTDIEDAHIDKLDTLKMTAIRKDCPTLKLLKGSTIRVFVYNVENPGYLGFLTLDYDLNIKAGDTLTVNLDMCGFKPEYLDGFTNSTILEDCML